MKSRTPFVLIPTAEMDELMASHKELRLFLKKTKAINENFWSDALCGTHARDILDRANLIAEKEESLRLTPDSQGIHSLPVQELLSAEGESK